MKKQLVTILATFCLIGVFLLISAPLSSVHAQNPDENLEICSYSEENQCGVCTDPLAVCTNVGAMLGYRCKRISGQCNATTVCNATTAGQCGVCPNANEQCVETTIMGGAKQYTCSVVAGSCGANSTNTCNSQTANSCSVCPNEGETCVETTTIGGAKTYNCQTVPGSCNTPTICCPSGYGSGFLDCPLNALDGNTCCKRTGFGQYETVAKISCSGTPDPFQLCNQIPAAAEKAKCQTCLDKQPSGIWTAVGCIQTDATSIVTQMIQIGLSLAGAVALLMILVSGFLFTTSQNDPTRVKEARDLVTSAVIGLLFIIFSVTILQFIGVTILQIPGFGSP